MNELIERLQKSAEHVRSTSKGGMEYEARLMEEAAAALEAAREDAEDAARYRWLRVNEQDRSDAFLAYCFDELDALLQQQVGNARPLAVEQYAAPQAPRGDLELLSGLRLRRGVGRLNGRNGR